MHVPIIIQDRLGQAQWQFTPRWAEDDTMAIKYKNARSETVQDKPVFSDSWLSGRRCLIPLNGFYEWKKVGVDQGPHFVTTASDHKSLLSEAPLFCLGGLWDVWQNGDEWRIGFTVLTRDARPELTHIHHREPVAFTPENGVKWLGATLDQAQEVMKDYQGLKLNSWRVRPDVGSIKNNDPALLEPDHHLALLI